MSFGSDDPCDFAYACDTKDGCRKERLCTFMIILAMGSVTAFCCISILDANEVSADRTVEVDGFVFVVIVPDREAVLKKCELSGDIHIPSSIRYTDKITINDISIGSEAFKGNKLTSVTIPGSVRDIGSSAFSNCIHLKSVTFENGVKSIDKYAFEDCISLTTVNIPDSVKSIGKESFRGCTCLASVTIGESVGSIGSNVFKGCTSLTSIKFNSVNCSDLSRCSNAFCKAGSLSTGIKVIFGDTVTRIPACLFCAYDSSDSPNIRSVIIGNNVRSIGDLAFFRCKSLTSVTIPDSVTSLGTAVFSHCTSMKSVTIGNGVSSIGSGAFAGCTSLISVVIPDSIRSIGSHAFYECKSLIRIDFDSANHIDLSRRSNVFSRAGSSGTGIKVVFGEGVTKIPAYLFYAYDPSDSPNITSVTIGNSVKSIGDDAFYRCISLKSVAISDSVISIGGSAFRHCRSLASVIIPDSVISIGSQAFSDCLSMTSVTIGSGVKSISNHAFYGCSSLIRINFNSMSCSDFLSSSDVFCDTGSPGTGIKVVFGDTVTRIPAYLFCNDCSADSSKITSVTFGNSIKSIGNNAFYRCTSLTYVNIPDSVEFIGNEAFSGCTLLASVTIGSSVESIEWMVFKDCRSLISVTIPDSVKFISSHAFDGCRSLTSVFIGKGVEFIGDSAFNGCSELVNVSILRTETVTKVCDHSFSGCKKLQNIYVPNTKYDDYLNAGCWFQMKEHLKPAAEVSALNVIKYDGSFQTCMKKY